MVRQEVLYKFALLSDSQVVLVKNYIDNLSEAEQQGEIAATTEQIPGKVRMRTASQAVKEIKTHDPESPINDHMVRCWIKQGLIQVVSAGNKSLINMDELERILKNGVPKKEVKQSSYGMIRKVEA